MSDAQPKKSGSKAPRKPTLLILLVIFCVGAVLTFASIIVILLANGLRPGESGLIRTGNLKLIAEPTNIEVQLNGEAKSLTNNIVSGLEPGVYTLTVSSPGYITWEKNIKVTAGLLEEVSVRLLPQNLPLKQFTQTNVKSVFFPKNADFVYYLVTDSSNPDENGIWRQRIVSPGPLNFFIADRIRLLELNEELLESSKANALQMNISPDNVRLLLTTSKSTYLLPADSATNTLTSELSLQSLVGYKPDQVEWVGNSGNLLLTTGNLRTVYDTAAGDQHVLAFRPLNEYSYSIAGSRLYFFDAQTKLLKQFVGGKFEAIPDVILPTTTKRIFGATNDTQIMLTENEAGEIELHQFTKKYTYKFPAGSKILQSSSDGYAYIIEVDGQRQIVNIREVRALNTFEAVVTKLDLPNINEFRFSANGNYILLHNDAGELIVAERDGGNPVVIANEIKVPLNAAELNSSSTQLFLFISESAVGGNIYTINLRP